ncbi:hypothetical protein ElyMa_003966500 [Elysia marginata]|uniref:Uncharacterized protein n=1 Tax=Elysia marginata TaxID=1093978 RepID=A0AAV4FXE3_9GAST|nr:hypothetical protein ElyMa_003966500 [Elysia marginata]
MKSTRERVNCVRSSITYRCLLEYVDAPVVLVLSHDNTLAVTLSNYRQTIDAAASSEVASRNSMIDMDFAYSMPGVVGVYPMLNGTCIPPHSAHDQSVWSSRVSLFVGAHSPHIIPYLKRVVSCKPKCVISMNFRQKASVILEVSKGLGVTHIVSDNEEVCYGETFRALHREIPACHLSFVPPLNNELVHFNKGVPVMANIRLQNTRPNCVLTEQLTSADMGVNTVWAAVEKTTSTADIPVFWGYVYVVHPGICFTSLTLEHLRTLNIEYVMNLTQTRTN